MDNKFKIIIIVVLLVLVLLVAGGGFFLYTMINSEPKEEVVYTPDKDVIAVIPFTEAIMTNLAGGSKTIRISMALGADSSSKQYSNFIAWFMEKEIVIRDAIYSLFRSIPVEAISSTEGEEELKIQIRDLVNDLFGTTIVYEVYFSNIVIQ